MFRINQRFTALFGCQFLLGVGMATAATVAPIFSNSSSTAIAQTVVDTLPPPPSLNKSNDRPPVLDEVFVPRDLDFRVPPSIAQKADSYLVYIDNANSIELEQIKQTIPTAFRRQHQGKTVIQAGVFRQEVNAFSLVYKLQSFGIPAHVFNLTTDKEVALKIHTAKF